ncbi:MAG: alpha/beta hydrolase [Planctomycetota bacterium]
MVYKTAGDAEGQPVDLSLHVFEPEGHRLADGRSAIVFFCGGGWTGGSPEQFYPHCGYLASRGMFATAAAYRVRSVHGATPFECVADGKSAIRYMRGNAEDLGIDPKRIAAGGGSAGGHVAACAGVIAGLDEQGEDLSVSSVPDAMVLFNPVIDTSASGFGGKVIGRRWRNLSPVHHVRPGLPPTIIFHGKADKAVPFVNAEAFAEAMKKAGNRCELLGFDGAGHGFFNFNRDRAAYNATVRAADEFLASLGFLEGTPAI